jgi:hypothetical protein
MRALAIVAATTVSAAAVDAHAFSSAVAPRTDLFELDGEKVPAARLQAALHDELRERALAGADVASLTELRLAMGCKPGEIECLARGGRAMGLDHMIVGALAKADTGYAVELTLIDVAGGDMLQEIRMTVATTALAADAIDATAASLVDGLFPGTAPPVVFTPIPTTTTTTAAPVDSPPPSQERGSSRPRWMWVAFGTSLGITTLFAAVSIGTQIRLKLGLRNELLEAVDESQTDNNPDNDIARGESDYCQAARVSPTNDGNVTNASVTRVCNQADLMSRVSVATGAIAAVGLVATLAFGVVVALNPKPRRKRALTLVPRVDFDRGASLVLGGRF